MTERDFVVAYAHDLEMRKLRQRLRESKRETREAIAEGERKCNELVATVIAERKRVNANIAGPSSLTGGT